MSTKGLETMQELAQEMEGLDDHKRDYMKKARANLDDAVYGHAKAKQKNL